MEILVPPDCEAEGGTLVRRLMVVSLERGYEKLLRSGDAVVVGSNADERIISLLEFHDHLRLENGIGLSGFLLSCKDAAGVSPQMRERLSQADLPVLVLDYDSADIARQVSHMTVKIQPYDTYKGELIAEAYKDSLKSLPICRDLAERPRQ